MSQWSYSHTDRLLICLDLRGSPSQSWRNDVAVNPGSRIFSRYVAFMAWGKHAACKPAFVLGTALLRHVEGLRQLGRWLLTQPKKKTHFSYTPALFRASTALAEFIWSTQPVGQNTHQALFLAGVLYVLQQ